MLQRFRPYFSYLRPHRTLLVMALLCGVIAGIATGAGLPLMVKMVFPVIFQVGATPLDTWALALVVLWIPMVFLVRGIAGYLNTYLIQLAGTRVLEALRLEFFRKLQLLPLSFFQKNSSGDLLSRGLSDANQLQVALTTIANEIVRSPATLIGSLAYITYMAYTEEGVVLVLVTLAAVPVTVLPIRYIGHKIVKRAGKIQAELGTMTNIFNENLSATREIRAFALEKREVSRFSAASQLLIRAQLKLAKYEKALAPLIEIISGIGIAFTLLYAYRVHLSQSTFTALIMALYACYEPIKKLGLLNSEMNRGLAAMDRLEVIFNEPISIADPVLPVASQRLRGELAFSQVTFAYKSEEPVLIDVDVRIPAGTVCALVGPSGAGKSTFAHLVPRFFEVSSGAVTVDGHDVRQLRLADLRRHIALVSQDPVLFNDTIYNNLLLGREDATREEVLEAARNAHADEFINKLEGGLGYDTIVGERGSRLSGGQKQRIAIARAFLRNAPILILDEATSALDSESEAAIQDALRKLVIGKTVLIIAHRFSTIRDASLILVFERGQIVARGDHGSLYAGNALYKSLYDRQATAL